MDPRFAAATEAFKAKRLDEGVSLLSAAIADANGAVPAQVYRQLGAELFTAGRYDQSRHWCEEGLKRYRKDFDLWNILGVAYRRLQNYPAALAALDQAQKLNPKSDAPLINKANVLGDMGDGPRGLEITQRLVRKYPTNAEYQRMTAIAHRQMHEWDKARARLEAALRLQPTMINAWLDLASIESGLQQHAKAVEIMDRALAANPDAERLMETRVVVLRRAGRYADAEAFLLGVLAKNDKLAWAHYQLARTLQDGDRQRANDHYRKAVALAPNNIEYRVQMAACLERSRYGDEGAFIQEAYELLVDTRKLGPIPRNENFMARGIFQRVGDFEGAASFGSFAEIGRTWARSNNHAAFLSHLARVETPEDRYELVEQHRMWGRAIQSHADQTPIVRPPRRAPDGKIRLGFMSSDLRNHPVGYFVVPLFDYLDDRFDLYCYSFNRGTEDTGQKYFASRSKAFRWNPTMSDRDAAQMIADDQLDLLLELGGSTHMNKLDVMAYRPSRLSGSWLGYPHSAGLEAIDYIVVDPYMTPKDPALLIEKPMTMPHTWLALGRGQFREQPAVDPVPPEERNGFITFGTANQPNKYGPQLMQTWAKVVAAVPKSQFLFVRPEGATPAFRENMLKYFAAEGVGPERIRFQAVRGAHLPFYNEIDISLDTFPLTGGTTTCESLWMGVPVVSLLGEALFERLSYSILSNAGLGDLTAETIDGYIEKAVQLAGDGERRRRLRATLRDQLKASPLGQTEQFAKDFYNMVAATVAAAD